MFFPNLIHSAELYLNNQLISRDNGLLNYDYYFRKLFGQQNHLKDIVNEFELIFWDTEDANSRDTSTNKGYAVRHKLITRDEYTACNGRLALNIWTQNKYLLPNCGLRFSLRFQKPENFLIANAEDKYTIEIKDFKFICNRLEIAPKLVTMHNNALATKPAIYNYSRYEIKCIQIPSNIDTVFNQTIHSGGPLPHTVLVTLADPEQMTGNIQKNPYNFTRKGLQSITISQDSELQIKKCFDDLHVTTRLAYKEFVEYLLRVKGRPISEPEFNAGYFILCFDMANVQFADQAHPSLMGSMKLDAKFDSALTNTVNLIVVSIFDGEIGLDNHKQCLVDVQTLMS
jgi:hypothetical protein